MCGPMWPHFSFMRSLIDKFESQFRSLHERSVNFAESAAEDLLFRRPSPAQETIGGLTVGESIIRSAAIVEMTFGGITRRLWDDPFEWTLPEALGSTAKIIGYLGEVETLRISGFGFFADDADLSRAIPAPKELRTLGAILLDTIARAEHFQGRSFALYQALGGGKLPRR